MSFKKTMFLLNTELHETQLDQFEQNLVPLRQKQTKLKQNKAALILFIEKWLGLSEQFQACY